MQFVESTRLERCAARMPLQLATRRLWNAPRAVERYGLELDTMLLDYSLANRCDNPRKLRPIRSVLASQVSRIDLGDQCSGFTVTTAHYESGATTGANGRMTSLCG